jgi:uncharacterized repeat protein (TIGR02543 family)
MSCSGEALFPGVTLVSIRMVRVLILLLWSVVALRGFAATTPADVYLNMETGSGGALVTSNLLNSATRGTGGSWTTFPNTLSTMRVTTDFEPVLGSQIFLDGQMYSDAVATRGYAFRDTVDHEYARFTFDETHAKVSMGCFLRVGDFDGSTFGSYDLIAMEGDDEFAVVNFQDFPDEEFVLQIHTQAGTRDPIQIRSNTTYWVTLLWDQPNRRSLLQVYDASAWELVGSGSIPLMNEVCRTVCFGRYDDHDITPGKYHFYDDLLIDYSTAEFPILPSRSGPAREPLFLSVDGAGTISGATNSQLLDVGRQYTITAKPAPGNLFAGWTGSTSSANASLKFVMTSNLTFTARFVPNPFLQLAGTYTGLFEDDSEPDQRSSGFMQLTLASSGSYSAKVMQNGKTWTTAGALAFDGSGECFFKRTGTNPLAAGVTLDLTNRTDRIEGFISERPTNAAALWTAAFGLNRSTFGSTNPAPQAGRYTICILPETNAPTSPQGEGYATISVTSKGAIACSGSLADGTKFSHGASLGKNGDWPLYVSLYHGKGSLVAGAIIDTNQSNGDIEGWVRWFKQAQPTAKVAPGGFTNLTSLLGSRYVAPTATQPLLNMTDGSVEFSFDNVATEFANQIQLTTGHRFVNQSANRLSLSVSKSTGRFSGSVVPPAGGKSISFVGALLQRQNLGGGYFLSTNRSGNVILGP